MEEIIIPLGICVALPVSIVLINTWSHIHDSNKRTEVLMGALERNNNVDIQKLMDSFSKPRKTALQVLNSRLLRGCIFSLVGLVLLITGLVNFAAGAAFEADPVTVPFMFGGISLAIGASFLIVYYITRKQVLGDEPKTEQ